MRLGGAKEGGVQRGEPAAGGGAAGRFPRRGRRGRSNGWASGSEPRETATNGSEECSFLAYGSESAPWLVAGGARTVGIERERQRACTPLRRSASAPMASCEIALTKSAASDSEQVTNALPSSRESFENGARCGSPPHIRAPARSLRSADRLAQPACLLPAGCHRVCRRETQSPPLPAPV